MGTTDHKGLWASQPCSQLCAAEFRRHSMMVSAASSGQNSMPGFDISFSHLELVQQVQVLLLPRAHESQQAVQRGGQHRLGPHLRRVGRGRQPEVALLQPLAGALQQCDSVLELPLA